MGVDKRDLIFISHATPEDNVFTLWLSTRLKLLGYEVWSDVTQLFGGEKWWDDIEEAVDHYTCKFIIVITRTSLTKPGVRREVELALEAEEKHQISNFIIPVIIDDSSFGGQPYGLSERNIIPFAEGWAPALARLIERMKRDCVPANSTVGDLGHGLQQHIKQDLRLVTEDVPVLSNWLVIESVPDNLHFYRLPINSRDFSKYLSSNPFSWFEWNGLLGTFADASSIEQTLSHGMRASSTPKLNLAAVLDKMPRNHVAFLRGEVIKKVNYLIADAWNKYMRAVGLREYEMTNGKIAWFFPDTKAFSGRLAYADIYGESRKRQIQGYSGKNNVFWHYALEVKAQYGRHPKLCLIPHVVFTTDGHNPLQNKTKMHSLRRGFCKMWWNDRWRDMLLSFLNLVSAGEKEIILELGRDSTIKICARPEIFTAPVSVSSNSDDLDDDLDMDIEVSLEADKDFVDYEPTE